MQPDTWNIMVLNGPNLNLLGTREPDIYGAETLDDINRNLKDMGATMGAAIAAYQSNHEGGLIDALHAARENSDGVIINAGGFTHTSVALRDAVSAIEIPVIEVHISNIHARESFRHTSLIAPVATGSIVGLGTTGYELALRAMLTMLRAR